MPEAHLGPYWFPCMLGNNHYLSPLPEKQHSLGGLFAILLEPCRENRSELPSAQPQPLLSRDDGGNRVGHTNLSFCFPPTARSWLTHILALELSICERQGRLNGSQSVDTSCPHFPNFPPLCLWLGGFFLLFFFFRVKHKQNTVQAVGSSSQCSRWILSVPAEHANRIHRKHLA